MFLNYLEETNKENFLKVCVHAALSNKIFAEEQKEILAAYCREMNVDVHIPETKENLFDLLKCILDNTTSAERNIFILEILALIKSDGEYDEKEKSFMTTLINELNVSEAKLDKFTKLLDKYTKIGKELYETIIK